MDSGFTHFGYSLHDGRRVHIAARIGFSISPDPDDPAVRICRLHLADS